MRARPLVAVFLAVAATGSVASAQRPEIAGDDGSRAASLAREVLARDSYVLIARDTVLGPEFTATELVVYDAEVRFEGSVQGAVVVIGGDLWLRPGSRIGGPVAVLGGGVYPSARAEVDRDSIFFPDPRGRIAVATVPGAAGDPDGWTASVQLTPARRPALVAPVLTALPTYDRVNGVTLRGEVLIRPTRSEEGPRVNAWLAFRSLQDDRVGGGVRWRIPLQTGGFHLTGEASRATRTNDGWIYGSIANSVRAVTLGSDYRDYWDADVARVMVDRPVAEPLIAGEGWIGPRAGVQLSRDRSLVERAPWSLFGRSGLARENPAIREGTIVSLLAGTTFARRAGTSRIEGSVDVEHAVRAAGGPAFTQALAIGRYSAVTFPGHQLSVYGRAMAPLGGTDAPPQRHGILGGSGTLPSEPIARFRGDHLVYVESAYLVALPWIALPVVGSPSVEASHRVGAAWTRGEHEDWVQNAGIGLVFSFVAARMFVNPAERPFRPHFGFGLSIPQR